MDLLKSRLWLITNPKQAKPGELMEALKYMDNFLEKENPDPRLKHFLQNRSYQKALLWIEGNEPEKGVCSK